MTQTPKSPAEANASDFRFTCPFCQQHLACEDASRGKEIQCPACQAKISIPGLLGLTTHAPTTGHAVGNYSIPVSPGHAPKIRVKRP